MRPVIWIQLRWFARVASERSLIEYRVYSSYVGQLLKARNLINTPNQPSFADAEWHPSWSPCIPANSRVRFTCLSLPLNLTMYTTFQLCVFAFLIFLGCTGIIFSRTHARSAVHSNSIKWTIPRALCFLWIYGSTRYRGSGGEVSRCSCETNCEPFAP